MKKIMALLGVRLLLSVLSVTPAFAAGPYTVVLDGLQSPRGLAFGPGGRLYVAQAGSGDNTGKVTEIRNPWAANPAVQDVASGLLSFGAEGEFESVDGISVLGNGGIYGIFGGSQQENDLPSPAGHLVKISQGARFAISPMLATSISHGRIFISTSRRVISRIRIRRSPGSSRSDLCHRCRRQYAQPGAPERIGRDSRVLSQQHHC